MSYDRVRQRNPTAGKPLQLWAYLDHQDLWYELFFRGRDGCLECGWLQELAGSEIYFKSVMKSLLAYSLIESHQYTESYSIHPVVRDWCTQTISHDKGDLVVAALFIIGAAVPDHSEVEYWVLQQRLVPHADRCVRQTNDPDVINRLGSVKLGNAFQSLGLLYYHQGKYTEAEKMYQRALDRFENIWGPDHSSTLDTVHNLGNLYIDQGKYIEAEKIY